MSDESDEIPEIKVTPELMEGVLELINNPPPPPKPGDPGYELDQLINCCMMCERDRRDKEAPYCDHCKPPPNYPDNAPEGQIFVCGACGKTAKCIYGDKPDSIIGWDESCMLNAVLCYADRKDENGLWVAVEGY